MANMAKFSGLAAGLSLGLYLVAGCFADPALAGGNRPPQPQTTTTNNPVANGGAGGSSAAEAIGIGNGFGGAGGSGFGGRGGNGFGGAATGGTATSGGNHLNNVIEDAASTFFDSFLLQLGNANATAYPEMYSVLFGLCPVQTEAQNFLGLIALAQTGQLSDDCEAATLFVMGQLLHGVDPAVGLLLQQGHTHAEVSAILTLPNGQGLEMSLNGAADGESLLRVLLSQRTMEARISEITRESDVASLNRRLEQAQERVQVALQGVTWAQTTAQSASIVEAYQRRYDEATAALAAVQAEMFEMLQAN